MLPAKEGLYHVSQINWSDSTVHRAGIIPFFIKGSQTLIGLGVTKFTAVIVSIGGAYEDQDFDLLTTAVREYNEETGSDVIEANIANCYAVLNKGTINILLPLTDRPDFGNNQELERVLWVTTKQLKIFAKRQTYEFRSDHESPRVLTMAQSLLNELPLLIQAIDSGIPAVPVIQDFYYTRSKKIPELKQTRISLNFDQLRADMADPSLFYGSASLVARGNYIAFERRDKVVYAFTAEHFQEFIKLVVANKIKVYVGFIADLDKYNRIIDSRRLLSIETRINKLRKSGADAALLRKIWKDFQDKVKYYRQFHDMYSVVWETILIHETEELIYRSTGHIAGFTNDTRSSFLEILNIANNYIIDNKAVGIDVPISTLLDYVTIHQQNKAADAFDVLYELIQLRLLVRNNNLMSLA